MPLTSLLKTSYRLQSSEGVPLSPGTGHEKRQEAYPHTKKLKDGLGSFFEHIFFILAILAVLITTA